MATGCLIRLKSSKRGAGEFNPTCGTLLFYYEVFEKEFDGKRWCFYKPDLSLPTNVIPARGKNSKVSMCDVFAKTSPECSPLSCNGMAKEIRTNEHCCWPRLRRPTISSPTGFQEAEPGLIASSLFIL